MAETNFVIFTSEIKNCFCVKEKKKILQSRSVHIARYFCRMYLVLTTHSWFTSLLGSLNKWETYKTFIDIHSEAHARQWEKFSNVFQICYCFFGRPLSFFDSHVLLFGWPYEINSLKKIVWVPLISWEGGLVKS